MIVDLEVFQGLRSSFSLTLTISSSVDRYRHENANSQVRIILKRGLGLESKRMLGTSP